MTDVACWGRGGGGWIIVGIGGVWVGIVLASRVLHTSTGFFALLVTNWMLSRIIGSTTRPRRVISTRR
jgi:hypothetical protein